MTREHATPVVVLNCRLGALAVMRSLGELGVHLYGVDGDPEAPALRSRYCRGGYRLPFDEERTAPYLEGLLDIGQRLGGPSILIPTSDETTQFVADHAAQLRRWFVFQDNPPELIRQLASKREMFGLALRHGVPTPDTRFPQCEDDVRAYAADGAFPVMLKGIYGNRLQSRTSKKMVIAATPGELIAAYREMEDPRAPNLMLQEYIPGGDDQVFIFNGYFDRNSDCLAGFTGFKVRQFPVHVGCASLGECRTVDEVATTTTRFMKQIGYRGILDIGYRLDPRDGRYKVLDINPRIGQAFRLFVAENNHDVARALYFDFTGVPQPPVVPREGRRWLIEDFDLISSYHYHREGTLGLLAWLRSFRGVEEAAWFNWRDPVPFVRMTWSLARRIVNRLAKNVAARLHIARRVKSALKHSARTVLPLPARKRVALAVHRMTWIRPERRNWWVRELVRDLAERDIDAFHQFLWEHHLGYAETYEVEDRFGPANIRPSRTLFFAELRQHLAGIGVPVEDVRTICEVGCSLGYQLSYMETDVFPHATVLEGIDIDRRAVDAGSRYLKATGSKVRLRCGDVDDLERLLQGRTFDLIVCTGVLMYLNPERAAAAMRVMLRHGRVVGLAGLAHPDVDNARLAASNLRPRDAAFIHNLDSMAEQGGGRVMARRWDGSREVGGNTVYFVFASPAAHAASFGEGALA